MTDEQIDIAIVGGGVSGVYSAWRLQRADLKRKIVVLEGGDDPFGGGWNSSNIGVRSPEVKQQIIQPSDKRALYICGEAYSDAQGWVEGALQTADMMLAKSGVSSLV